MTTPRRHEKTQTERDGAIVSRESIRLGNLAQRARSMRLHTGLSKMFWVEVISTAAYLLNRDPSVSIDNKLLEEEWIGKSVNLSHLKVFDCLLYTHQC